MIGREGRDLARAARWWEAQPAGHSEKRLPSCCHRPKNTAPWIPGASPASPAPLPAPSAAPSVCPALGPSVHREPGAAAGLERAVPCAGCPARCCNRAEVSFPLPLPGKTLPQEGARLSHGREGTEILLGFAALRPPSSLFDVCTAPGAVAPTSPPACHAGQCPWPSCWVGGWRPRDGASAARGDPGIRSCCALADPDPLPCSHAAEPREETKSCTCCGLAPTVI